MKAIVYEAYGSPENLQLKEVEKPSPKDDEVLVKVHAAAANAGDWYLLTGNPFMVRFDSGLFKPKSTIPGSDIAGVVEAVGKDVMQFQVGDAVYGDLSDHGRGGLAEYVCAPQSVLALKPTNLTFAEAAAVPMAAVTALQGVRDKGEIKAGQKVLINGASGGVGSYAVQLAKSFGAEVTGVCSTSKIDLVRSLGADHVIDYTKEDFTQNGQTYDLIIAVNGKQKLVEYKRALTPTGRYVCIGGSMVQIFQGMLFGSLMSKKGGIQMETMLAHPNQDDLIFVRELIESGKIKPVIDKQYSLNETAAAFQYLGEGHARGKIIIGVS